MWNITNEQVFAEHCFWKGNTRCVPQILGHTWITLVYHGQNQKWTSDKCNKLILWYKYLMYNSHETEGITSVLNSTVKWQMDKWLFQLVKQGSLVWDLRLSQQCCRGLWMSEVWHYSNGWVATDTCGAFIFLFLKAKALHLFKMRGTTHLMTQPHIPEYLNSYGLLTRKLHYQLQSPSTTTITFLCLAR